jgi:hypothetical protein
MHGTFRARTGGETMTAVRYGAVIDVPRDRRWRSNAALLLAGCCLAALPAVPGTIAPNVSTARQPREKQPMARAANAPSPSLAPVRLATHAEVTPVVRSKAEAPNPVIAPPAPTVLADPVPAPEPAGAAPSPESGELALAMAVLQPVRVDPNLPLPEFADTARVVPAESIEPLAPTIAAVAAANLLPGPRPGPTVVVALPDAPLPQAMKEAGRRLVDIAQISDSEAHSLRVPQLHEQGLAADGEPTLAAKVAAMQVTPLPPPRLRNSERATLLAEAPTRMTIRIGDAALGKVDFHMTADRAIDVQLSGLLNLLASHYDSAEFTRLRNSAAADSYVSFDQLRALGLTVRYDSVYDELRING